MNVIDRSEFRDEEGVITLEKRVRGTLQHGLGWYGVMQAQMFVSERLEKTLDGSHTLLRNVVIRPSSWHGRRRVSFSVHFFQA